jgi:hypothetical protein
VGVRLQPLRVPAAGWRIPQQERSENGQIETHQATGRLACSCRMPMAVNVTSGRASSKLSAGRRTEFPSRGRCERRICRRSYPSGTIGQCRGDDY